VQGSIDPVTYRSMAAASLATTAAMIASTWVTPVIGGTSHAEIGVGVGAAVAPDVADGNGATAVPVVSDGSEVEASGARLKLGPHPRGPASPARGARGARGASRAHSTSRAAARRGLD